MGGAHGRPLKNFGVSLYILGYYFRKLGGAGESYAYCGCEWDCFCELAIRQPICTIRQPIAVLHIFFHNSYIFGRFLLGGTSPIGIGWRIVLWYSVSLLQWENTH
jgi:hypothetical protein